VKNAKINVGGQAVIEGVMMRNKGRLAVAIRQMEGGIVVINSNFVSFADRFPILKWPILRGVSSFFEALILGFQTLSTSASYALEEEEIEMKGWELPLTMIVSLMLGIGLFILLPTVIMNFARQGFGIPILLNLCEGLLRITIFLSYILAISRWKDVSRVFEYHGAEHKAIACYEAGAPLTVENTKSFSSLHRRCGTNFMLIVMVTSILLFSFFGWPILWQRIILRLMLLPLVAGLSYEVIRAISARDNLLTRIVSQPGLWLQQLTTKKPADDQVEVALCALKAVLSEDKMIGPTSPGGEFVTIIPGDKTIPALPGDDSEAVSIPVGEEVASISPSP
jgi:uncharacterized protein YqhQ